MNLSATKPYRLSIGPSDFLSFAASNSILVDKTLLIKDIIEDSNEVTLITRPRRWGKTLNMSMLEYFFAIPTNKEGVLDEEAYKQKKEIFSKLKIGGDLEIITQYCGHHPVIFVSFTSTKTDTIQALEEKLSEIIYGIFNQHEYLLRSQKLNDAEITKINTYLTKIESRASLEKAIFYLSEMLYKHFGQKVVLLIDEYDTPLNDCYIKAISGYGYEIESDKYFHDALDLFRNIMEAALKNNANILKGVVTGILRVAKANLFSGMNNFGEDSLLDSVYPKHYGFTEEEVHQLLSQTGIDNNAQTIETMKVWYNGYNINGVTIYNPWSIMNWLNYKGSFRAYWVGTANTTLIENALILDKFQEEIQHLMEGGTVNMTADPQMVFGDITSSPTALYNLLLFSGYLTIDKVEYERGRTYDCLVRIPNKEILEVYEVSIIRWLSEKFNIATDEYKSFIRYLLEGDIEVFAEKLQYYIEVSSSFYSSGPKNAEIFYNGLMLGLISTVSNKYFVETEKETGNGRADLILVPKDTTDKNIAFILEYKIANKEEDLAEVALTALEQIKQKNYISKIKNHNNVTQVINLGIAFCGKNMKLEYLKLDL